MAEQTTNTHRHLIGRYIAAIIEEVENPPFRGDLIPQFAVMGLARRAVNCHLAIEVGLKALIEQSGGEFKHRHGLLSHLRRLDAISVAEGENPRPTDFLRSGFVAAVEFYRLNANVAPHLGSLDDYFDATGGSDAYDKYRYWILSQSPYPAEMQKFNLGIHIEIMHSIWELLSDRTRTLHDRVEGTVAEALQKGLMAAASERRNNDEHDFAMRFIKDRRSCSQAFTEAAEKDFQLGDEFANLAFSRASGVLSGSTDTAIRHFVSTRFVLPPPPREIPVPPFVEHHEATAAEVLSPGGTLLGWLQKRQDGLWAVEFWHGANPDRGLQLMNRRVDGLRWIAQRSTVEIICVTQGEQPVRRRMLGSPRAPFLGAFSGRSQHVLEMWDDDHGWEVGQEIVVRVPFEDIMDQTLEGRIVEIEGHTVVIQGKVLVGPRAIEWLQSNDDDG